MSYRDPQGGSERGAWEPLGDQREPDRVGGDDPRRRAFPGSTGSAAYPAAPDRTGFPYGTDASPRGVDPYGPGVPRSTPHQPAQYHQPAHYHDPAQYQPGQYQPDQYEPGQYQPDGYAGGYEPHRREADRNGLDGYQPDPYQTGGHQAPQHRIGGYEPDPYRPGGRSEQYRADPEPPPREYLTSGAGESGRNEPTDPVGWAPLRADPPGPTGGHPMGSRPDPVPAADPYADTQTLPRVGAERPADPADPSPAVQGAPATARSATSRAGRNLPAAIGVGLALGALIVVPLFVYPPAFLVVIAAAASVGTWELSRAVRQGSGAEPPLPTLLGGGLLMVGLAWWAGPDALSLALLVTVLATLVWRLGDGPRGFQRDLTAATLIAVYVPFLGGFAALLAATPTDGHLRVLVTLVAVVLSDTGGYAAGVTLGKHPMAPSVSPKKSWEGFAGSMLAAAGGSAVLLWLLLDVSPIWGALFGFSISVAAVLGDLGESMIKRDLGVKDMSNLLPGHGGLMDRLDSVLFAMPVAYLLLALVVPAG